MMDDITGAVLWSLQRGKPAGTQGGQASVSRSAHALSERVSSNPTACSLARKKETVPLSARDHQRTRTPGGRNEADNSLDIYAG